MTDKDKRKLLQALDDKEAEALVNEAEPKVKETDEFKNFWNGYKAGIRDARELIEEFGRPTEDVLG